MGDHSGRKGRRKRSGSIAIPDSAAGQDGSQTSHAPETRQTGREGGTAGKIAGEIQAEKKEIICIVSKSCPNYLPSGSGIGNSRSSRRPCMIPAFISSVWAGKGSGRCSV